MLRTISLPRIAIPKSKALFVAVCALTLLVLTVVIGLSTTKDVEISDNGSVFKVSMTGGTVAQALERGGISLISEDIVAPALNSMVGTATQISITRAMPYYLMYQGAEKTVWTTSNIVKDIIESAGVIINEKDVVQPALDSVLEKNATITITLMDEAMLTESVPVPFETITKPSYSLLRGTKKVAIEGVEGVKELVYKVITRDGVEASRELVGEKIVKKPVARVVELGVMGAKASPRDRTSNLASRGDLRYRKVIDCVATAYDADSCGKSSSSPSYGKTASGMMVKPGVVAVDPRLIPLGTKLFIESADGSNNYGFAIAADTGGAIKGNRIDLYMDSRKDALDWGRRKVKVFVLED